MSHRGGTRWCWKLPAVREASPRPGFPANSERTLLLTPQAQQGKDEVMLEFLPDTGAAEKEDALCEMTFYVPRDNERYAGDDTAPSSKVQQ